MIVKSIFAFGTEYTLRGLFALENQNILNFYIKVDLINKDENIVGNYKIQHLEDYLRLSVDIDKRRDFRRRYNEAEKVDFKSERKSGFVCNTPTNNFVFNMDSNILSFDDIYDGEFDAYIVKP